MVSVEEAHKLGLISRQQLLLQNNEHSYGGSSALSGYVQKTT